MGQSPSFMARYVSDLKTVETLEFGIFILAMVSGFIFACIAVNALIECIEIGWVQLFLKAAILLVCCIVAYDLIRVSRANAQEHTMKQIEALGNGTGILIASGYWALATIAELIRRIRWLGKESKEGGE